MSQSRKAVCRTPQAQLLFLIAITLCGTSGCGSIEGVPLPDTSPPTSHTPHAQLIARFAHITDTHIVDEESPARLTSLANINEAAWRPHEQFSIHLLDGTIRALNRYHETIAPIDFLIHTGDAIDNVQNNELRWFLACFDGAEVNPLSGVDDRTTLNENDDPHAVFQAEGLYQYGVHGLLPSIPWYSAFGNHDRYAAGTFPITSNLVGELIAPLPLGLRFGLFLPTALIPHGSTAYAPVTPAHPIPDPGLSLPEYVIPSADRAFVRPWRFLEAHFETKTLPKGHGFADVESSWYSVSPTEGLRLIVLDTSYSDLTIPTGLYNDGAITSDQYDFLVSELQDARKSEQLVVLATHHPSTCLTSFRGSVVSSQKLRDILNDSACVIAHISGHTHRHRVWDRGNYLEFETSSIIDYPQEGRLVEVWRDESGIELRYEAFSHTYEGSAFDGNIQELPDPFLEMRATAMRLSQEHSASHNLVPIYSEDLLSSAAKQSVLQDQSPLLAPRTGARRFPR